MRTEMILRRVVFRPYLAGKGPVFSLLTYDTGRINSMGKYLIGYHLKMAGRVLFEGEDFGCSPLHAIDSDATIAGLMGFLTLRPGDTDAEYFKDYTPEQLDYCSHHAEALACEVSNRFPEG